MKSYTIYLDTVEKIKSFVAITATFPFEVDICSDRYVIDAKSILGIFSLDISKPMTLKAQCPDDFDLEGKLSPFLK